MSTPVYNLHVSGAHVQRLGAKRKVLTVRIFCKAFYEKQRRHNKHSL